MRLSPVLRKLISVMVPILIAQLSTVGMNFLDTAMSGHAGKVDLAGVSVGASLFMPILVATTGVLAAATPMIAQHLGKKETAAIPETMRTGFCVGLLLSVLFAGIYAAAIDPVLAAMRLEPEVEHIARYYLLAMTAAVFFETPVMVMRSLTDTVGGTSISMRLFLLALPIDAFLNYLFIFGNFGVPRMGGIGAGIATALTYLILLAMFLAVVMKDPVFMSREIFGSCRMRLVEGISGDRPAERLRHVHGVEPIRIHCHFHRPVRHGRAGGASGGDQFFRRYLHAAAVLFHGAHHPDRGGGRGGAL